MSPVSSPVLGTAALVSSPALWSALVTGTTPPFVGLSRFLVAVLMCWLALAFVSTLVGPPPRVTTDESADATEQPQTDREPVTSEAAR